MSFIPMSPTFLGPSTGVAPAMAMLPVLLDLSGWPLPLASPERLPFFVPVILVGFEVDPSLPDLG